MRFVIKKGELTIDDKMPLVSIITVTKNSEKFLEQTILSVVNQTYPKIQYLIFDGLSDDGTIGIIEKYDEFIDTWVSEPDGSMYEAINKAIENASGDIIAILNSDDRYVDDNVISGVVKKIRKLDADGIYGDLVIDYGDKHKYKKVFQVSFEEYLLSGKGTFVPHITLFLKKKCFDVIGMYDQQYKYAADYDFILRCLDRCKIKYIGMPVSIFRRHAGSISASGRIKTERVCITKKYGHAKYSLPKKKFMYAWLWAKYYITNARHLLL